MFILLLYTQKEINAAFIGFFLISFTLGLAAEMIGTNTGWLFGNYSYGNALGYKINNVPLIIGLNWVVIIYCSGITTQVFLNKFLDKLTAKTGNPRPSLKALSVIVDGATLALLFDWIMEPVAIKLGFWTWAGDGNTPFFNYFCWFLLSILLLTCFHFTHFNKHNKFAVNLLLIQLMFFLLLRTFL